MSDDELQRFEEKKLSVRDRQIEKQTDKIIYKL